MAPVYTANFIRAVSLLTTTAMKYGEDAEFQLRHLSKKEKQSIDFYDVQLPATYALAILDELRFSGLISRFIGLEVYA